MLYPLKFIPVYKDYIWGGRNLERYGRILPEGAIAESWDLSCHPNGVSVIANGRFKGITLPELLKIYGSKIMGYNFPEIMVDQFPLLVKLIDANEKLSVQVHPNDEYAAVFEDGGFGKNEMWYVLDSKPGSKLVHGVIPGTTKAEFAYALRNNEVERYLKYIEVYPGDVINIPAGVVHAIGEGIMIAEIQQNSNTTYRIYDYDRVDHNGNKRELHVEQALNVIDFSYGGIKQEKTSGLKIILDAQWSKTFLVASRFFAAELYEVDGNIFERADGSKFYIYIWTEGQGEINYPDGSVQVKAGETVLIPASLGNYFISGSFKALKAYIPNLSQDIVANLKNAGYSKECIYQIISGTG